MLNNYSITPKVLYFFGNFFGGLSLCCFLFGEANSLPFFLSSLTSTILANIGALLIFLAFSLFHILNSERYDACSLGLAAFALVVYPGLLPVNFLPFFLNNPIYQLIANLMVLLIGILSYNAVYAQYSKKETKATSPFDYERNNVLLVKDKKIDGEYVGHNEPGVGSMVQGCTLTRLKSSLSYAGWARVLIKNCKIDHVSFYSLLRANVINFVDCNFIGVDYLSFLLTNDFDNVEFSGAMDFGVYDPGLQVGKNGVTADMLKKSQGCFRAELYSKLRNNGFIDGIANMILGYVCS